MTQKSKSTKVNAAYIISHGFPGQIPYFFITILDLNDYHKVTSQFMLYSNRDLQAHLQRESPRVHRGLASHSQMSP